MSEARESLFTALAALVLDHENDDPAEWTEERLLKRVEDLLGEGWYHAGKAEERLRDTTAELAATREALTMLRDAWTQHFATCPSPPPSYVWPTDADYEAWKNAPSDTASA